MKRFISLFCTITCLLLATDVTLSIENFVDNGSTVEFDIMMVNSEPVQGFQFDLWSGNGVFDDDPTCVCDQTDSSMPGTCLECYYDYGIDKVKNNKEADTSISGHLYGCEVFSTCSDPSLTSSECEDEGVCSGDAFDINGSGIISQSECSADGSCSISSYISQCECEQSGAVWSSSNFFLDTNN